jgi:nuclear receptor interaction protein
MLAVSGIDNTIKIFSSDNRAQRDARLGHNLAATQRQSESNFTTIGRRRFLRPQRRSSPDAADPLLGEDDNSPDSNERNADTARRDDHGDDSDDALLATEHLPATRRGLASRRRMQDSYSIMSQNRLDSQGGMDDRFITVGPESGPLPRPRILRLTFAEWQGLFDD